MEDEDQIVRSLDRDMPLGNYMLQVDEGIVNLAYSFMDYLSIRYFSLQYQVFVPNVLGLVVKICVYDESDHMPVHTEEKIFYTEDDYRDFLARRGWTCLREFDNYRNIDNMDDLRPGGIYRGVS